MNARLPLPQYPRTTASSALLLCLTCLLFSGTGIFAAQNNSTGANDAADARQPLVFKPLPKEKDADGDFLVDEFEKTIINTYAPYLIFHPRETCWPSSAMNHLQHANLRVRTPIDRGGANAAGLLKWKSVKVKKPNTWAELLSLFQQQCVSGQRKYEDMYMALLLDKRALIPGAPIPPYPATDFCVESQLKAKAAIGVYRGRVMTPVYRPVMVKVIMFEPNGNCYEGVARLDLFSGGGQIPNAAESRGFALTSGDTGRLNARFKVNDIRAALGLDKTPPMPNGPTFAWGKAKAELVVGGDAAIPAVFVPRFRSPRGEWIKTGNGKRCAYFTTGPVHELVPDLDFIHETYTSIPNPKGGAEIYAHVYPLADFIVVQYWLFFGYTDHDTERHEADWGDRLDIILYRNDPAADGKDDNAVLPRGVIPAYRAKQSLTQNMIAMAAYVGKRANFTFYRKEDSPEQLSQSISKLKKFKNALNMAAAIKGLNPVRIYQQWKKLRGIKLAWRGNDGKISKTGTHMEAYVARGTHQLYPVGGEQATTKRVKKVITKIIIDSCAPKLGFKGKLLTKLLKVPERFLRNPIRVLPQTTSTEFAGKAYVGEGVDAGSDDSKISLKGQGAFIKIVNVGEVTASHRERMMRYDSKINGELVKAWGHVLPEESKQEALEREEMRRELLAKLRTPIKNALKTIREEAEQQAAKQKKKKKGSRKGGSRTSKKKTVLMAAEEMVKQVRSKIWQKIIEAKKAVKTKHKNALDEKLNELVADLIREEIGVVKVKPQLVLSRTAPMPGGEFIDYPGRWGRIPSANTVSPLIRQDSRNFLEYEMPDDRKMQMLRNLQWSGPTGPAGGKPERYLKDFYRDYDAVAKKLVVYGVAVDL